MPGELVLVVEERKWNFNDRVKALLQLFNLIFKEIASIVVLQIFKENACHLSEYVLSRFSNFLIFMEKQNFEEGVFRSRAL